MPSGLLLDLGQNSLHEEDSLRRGIRCRSGGHGVTWNAELFESLLQAAEQEDPDAQCVLGMTYSAGRRVPQD
jgi:TPR repeat protein